MLVTRMPRDSRIAAREAAAMPFPREETTPPVTNTYFVIYPRRVGMEESTRFYPRSQTGNCAENRNQPQLHERSELGRGDVAAGQGRHHVGGHGIEAGHDFGAHLEGSAPREGDMHVLRGGPAGARGSLEPAPRGGQAAPDSRIEIGPDRVHEAQQLLRVGGPGMAGDKKHGFGVEEAAPVV